MTGEGGGQQDGAERARALFWRELVQLKIDAEYIQRYRDRLTRYLTWVDVARAVVSVGALGSWIAGLGYPQLWAGIIVVSQVGEAVLGKLPLSARQKGLVTFGNALDAIFIDALFEWESIDAEPMKAPEITRRWHTLMRVRHEAEMKSIGDGLPFDRRLFRLAEQAAESYFKTNYGVGRLA